MSIEELLIREGVRKTLSEYTAATDRFDLAALAACFALTGELEFTGGAGRLVGPAAIEAGLARAMAGGDDTRPSPTFVRHHVASVHFADITAQRVEASSYFAVYTDIGLDHWGRYRDELVPAAGRWLFARRRISVDAFSTGSLMSR